MNRKRNPNKANLSGLVAINADEAYDPDKKQLKKGVYGIVSKDTPYIYKNQLIKKSNKNKRIFVNDLTNIPNVCKERIMEFWDNNDNFSRRKLYLADKDILNKKPKKEG